MTGRQGYHRDSKRLVEFSCGHKRYFDSPLPSVGDELNCRHCKPDSISTVIGYATEYWWNCETCTYTRYHGPNGFASSAQQAFRHYTRFPSHTIQEWHGDEKLHRYLPQSEKLFIGDMPF